MSSKSALILGATGSVGRNLLRELLTSNKFARVGEFGRRTTPEAQLEGLPREKLVQKVIDFEKLDSAGFLDEKWDVVFITLGTTRKNAGGAEQFIKIDQEYVVNAARAAKNSELKQRLLYCSSIGADAKSMALYTRSKGETEQRLASLGYADTTVFRPAMLAEANRGESRPAETIAGVITGILSKVSDAVSIPVSVLAKSMRLAGEFDSAGDIPAVAQPYKGGGTNDVGEYTIIGNKGALKLAQTS